MNWHSINQHNNPQLSNSPYGLLCVTRIDGDIIAELLGPLLKLTDVVERQATLRGGMQYVRCSRQ